MAEQRPGIYRMLDASGRVLYVGKAKLLRSRLLSYFHAKYPEDKGARILHAANDVTWEYASSEFAAHLAELREIRKCRPPYNVQMNRTRSIVFIGVADGAAPKLSCTRNPARGTRSATTGRCLHRHAPLSRSGYSTISSACVTAPTGCRCCSPSRAISSTRLARPPVPATTSAPAAGPAPGW